MSNTLTSTTAQTSSVSIRQQASVTVPSSGTAKLWVRDDSPNVLVFTNDAGTSGLVGAAADLATVLSNGNDAAGYSIINVSSLTWADGNGIAIGSGASTGSPTGVYASDAVTDIGIGLNASVDELVSNAGGYSAPGGSIAIGDTSSITGGGNNIAIGASAAVSGGASVTGGVAIGDTAIVQAVDGIAIGSTSTCAHANSIAIGNSAITTAANQLSIHCATSATPSLRTTFEVFTGTAPTGGALAIPANAVAFWRVTINGTAYDVPLFNADST